MPDQKQGKHTPGKLIYRDDDPFLRAEDDGNLVAAAGGLKAEEQRDNLKRLALCWNTHDQLVKALAEIRDEVRGLSRNSSLEDLGMACDKADKALAEVRRQE